MTPGGTLIDSIGKEDAFGVHQLLGRVFLAVATLQYVVHNHYLKNGTLTLIKDRIVPR